MVAAHAALSAAVTWWALAPLLRPDKPDDTGQALAWLAELREE